MEIGDVFYIHVLSKTLAYEVDQIQVILPEELDVLKAESEKDLVTLLTCTPYSVNTHRLLVRGSRIPYEEANEDTDTRQKVDTGWLQKYILAILLGLAALLILWIVLWIRRKRMKRREEDS